MMMNLKQAKQAIRPYLQQITDQQLSFLTAMAQDGKVEYSEHCKCIRGIVGGCTFAGYCAENSDVAGSAERALLEIGYLGKNLNSDPHRNLILYPMCRAEQRRRESVRTVEQIKVRSREARV